MGKHRNLTLAALLDDPRLSGQLRCELRCELKHIQKLKLVKEVRERRRREEPREALSKALLGAVRDGGSRFQRSWGR